PIFALRCPAKPCITGPAAPFCPHCTALIRCDFDTSSTLVLAVGDRYAADDGIVPFDTWAGLSAFMGWRMISRGIVISPPFQPLLGGGIRCGGQPDPSELRKYLLYWDQIDYPTNNLVHITSSDIEYLESTQALKRTRVVFEGASSTGRGEFFVQAQEAALRENLKIQPGAWSLAQLSESPHYTESTFGI